MKASDRPRRFAEIAESRRFHATVLHLPRNTECFLQEPKRVLSPSEDLRRDAEGVEDPHFAVTVVCIPNDLHSVLEKVERLTRAAEM